MPAKVFVTGITGYIGGDAFHVIQQTHPELEFSALIRTEDKAQKVREKYPKVRVVLGDLDDADKIAKEAAWADIVIRSFGKPYNLIPELLQLISFRHRRCFGPCWGRKCHREGDDRRP